MALKDGLVSHWKFDSDLLDAYGSNDMTNQGTADVAGKLGKSREMIPEDTEYMTLTQVGLSASSSTIACWIQKNGTQGADVALLGQDGNDNYYVLINGGNVAVRAGGSPVVFTVPSVATSTWHYLVITRDAGETRVYFNGVESSSGELTLAGSLDIDQIGRLGGGSELYRGRIDELSIWSTVKTEAEIGELYRNGDGLLFSDWDVSSTLTVSGPSGKGTKTIATRWPVEEGLQAGTQKQKGRQSNLVPERSSLVPDREKVGF